MKYRRILSVILALALLVGCAGPVEMVANPRPLLPGMPATSATVEVSDATPATTLGGDWAPQHGIKLIVAYKEGSSTDYGARLLAEHLSEQIGQPVTVRNIAANAGMAGWETLADASPDGYTLGFVNLPNLFTAIDNGGKFNVQSFTPICNHVVETSVVVVPENSPTTRWTL